MRRFTINHPIYRKSATLFTYRQLLVTPSYEKILEGIDPLRAVVLTDIDDSVLTTHPKNTQQHHLAATYPGEAYFAAVSEVLATCPLPAQRQLFPLLMRDYRFGQQYAAATLVQPQVRKTFAKLKSMKVPTFGFTARGLDTCPQKHVKKTGLHFTKSHVKPFVLGPHSKDSKQSIYFAYGSVLLSGSCKGHGLELFYAHKRMQRFLKKRDQVIFIDDKESNCESFKEYAEKIGVEAKVYHFPVVEKHRQQQTETFDQRLRQMHKEADELQAQVFQRLTRK